MPKAGPPTSGTPGIGVVEVNPPFEAKVCMLAALALLLLDLVGISGIAVGATVAILGSAAILAR